ncbi:putative Forkhead box protein G1 [Quillaja saponaria]|uniref:Forkhead box protein G1 n=1 Tax=Quillaja saponaria TaxID=32244 RepID=A0AAD7PAG4_QUISA|nr:putative Forkhead box protein G1 [Quillaja saponaria]
MFVFFGLLDVPPSSTVSCKFAIPKNTESFSFHITLSSFLRSYFHKLLIIMSFNFFPSLLRRVALTKTRLLYAAIWTVLLTLTVALASLAPGMAFVSAVSPSSSFLKSCDVGIGFVWIPLDLPRDKVCLPNHMVTGNSDMDFFLPALFAALVVGASVCVLRSMAFWEDS